MKNPILDIQNKLSQIQDNFLVGSTDFEQFAQDLRQIAKSIRQCEGGKPGGTAKKMHETIVALSTEGVAAAVWWHRFETRRLEFYKLKVAAIATTQGYLDYCLQELELGAGFGAAA